MIPELGNFALILAMLLALIQGTLPIIGAARGIPSWVALARPVVQGQFVFVAIAFFCLAYSFVNNDFSVMNVAQNSNSKLPLEYRFAATWGSHEGSLLLWVLMLATWSVAVSVFSRRLPDDMVARVLGVMGLVSVGFLLFLLFTSNPFDRLLPGAPEGSRGISLFLVPKFLVNEDGTPGERNDVRVVSLEHKLGIHASPTCVMSYGDKGECIGELVGRENEGLKAMFTMMNSARINVGNQGVQIAERATQQAMAYARERVQSPRAGGASRAPVPIIEHPDVRRMLLRMKALTEGARALLYYTSGMVDRGALGNAAAQARADLLVPLIKAWGTDIGMEVASLGIQVHGGMGYIAETGVAQYLRDARIPPIYEGTNGIQVADLVTRKLSLENGGVLVALLREIASDGKDEPYLAALARECAAIGEWMLHDATLDDRLAGSVPFCTMCAVATAGWQLLRQLQAVERGEAPALAATKPVTVRFFLDCLVPEALGLAASARAGAELLYTLDAERLAG